MRDRERWSKSCSSPFFPRHPSTFPCAPRSHQISVVPRPRDEPFSKNAPHCRRQLSPSGNPPLPPAVAASFSLSANFCLPTSQPDVPPPRPRCATESFTDFKCNNAGPEDKGLVGVWVVADYSKNLASLSLSIALLFLQSRVHWAALFFLFPLFLLFLFLRFRVFWVVFRRWPITNVRGSLGALLGRLDRSEGGLRGFEFLGFLFYCCRMVDWKGGDLNCR